MRFARKSKFAFAALAEINLIFRATREPFKAYFVFVGRYTANIRLAYVIERRSVRAVR